MSGSLIEQVQRLLERTYDLESGRVDVGAFLIGDDGYRRLYGDGRPARNVGSEQGDGSRVLVRETERGLRACIYFPDRMIEALERHPPQRGLGDRNVDPFATLVEELDHLLCLADRAARKLPVSMLELEVQANVSKYLVLARFLAGRRGRLSPRSRTWLRYHLFEKARFVERDPAVRRRYRDARRFAVRFIDGASALDPRRFLALLRRFHQETIDGKLRLIQTLHA